MGKSARRDPQPPCPRDRVASLASKAQAGMIFRFARSSILGHPQLKRNGFSRMSLAHNAPASGFANHPGPVSVVVSVGDRQ